MTGSTSPRSRTECIEQVIVSNGSWPGLIECFEERAPRPPRPGAETSEGVPTTLGDFLRAAASRSGLFHLNDVVDPPRYVDAAGPQPDLLVFYEEFEGLFQCGVDVSTGTDVWVRDVAADTWTHQPANLDQFLAAVVLYEYIIGGASVSARSDEPVPESDRPWVRVALPPFIWPLWDISFWLANGAVCMVDKRDFAWVAADTRAIANAAIRASDSRWEIDGDLEGFTREMTLRHERQSMRFERVCVLESASSKDQVWKVQEPPLRVEPGDVLVLGAGPEFVVETAGGMTGLVADEAGRITSVIAPKPHEDAMELFYRSLRSDLEADDD